MDTPIEQLSQSRVLSAVEQELEANGIPVLNHDIGDLQQYLNKFAEKAQPVTKTIQVMKTTEDGEQIETTEKILPISYYHKKGMNQLDAIYINDDTGSAVKMIRIDNDAKFRVTEHDLIIYNTKLDVRYLQNNKLGLNTESDSDHKNGVIVFSLRNGNTLTEPSFFQVGNCDCSYIAQHSYDKDDHLNFVFVDKGAIDSFTLYRYSEKDIANVDCKVSKSLAKEHSAVMHTVELLDEFDRGYKRFVVENHNLLSQYYGFHLGSRNVNDDGERQVGVYDADADRWRNVSAKLDEERLYMKYNRKTGKIYFSDHSKLKPVYSSLGILPIDILFSNKKYLHIFEQALRKEAEAYDWGSGKDFAYSLSFTIDKTAQYGALTLTSPGEAYEHHNAKSRPKHSLGIFFSFEQLLKVIVQSKTDDELYESAAKLMQPIRADDRKLNSDTRHWDPNDFSGGSWYNKDISELHTHPLERGFFLHFQRGDRDVKRSDLDIFIYCTDFRYELGHEVVFNYMPRNIEEKTRITTTDTFVGQAFPKEVFARGAFYGSRDNYHYIYEVERSNHVVHKKPLEWKLEYNPEETSCVGYANARRDYYKTRLIHFEFDANFIKKVEQTLNKDEKDEKIEALKNIKSQIEASYSSSSISGTFDFSYHLCDARRYRIHRYSGKTVVGREMLEEDYKNGDLTQNYENLLIINSSEKELDYLKRLAFMESHNSYQKTFSNEPFEVFGKIKPPSQLDSQALFRPRKRSYGKKAEISDLSNITDKAEATANKKGPYLKRSFRRR